MTCRSIFAIYVYIDNKKRTALSSGPWEVGVIHAAQMSAQINPTDTIALHKETCDSQTGIPCLPNTETTGIIPALRRHPLSPSTATWPCQQVLMNPAPLSSDSIQMQDSTFGSLCQGNLSINILFLQLFCKKVPEHKAPVLLYPYIGSLTYILYLRRRSRGSDRTEPAASAAG